MADDKKDDEQKEKRHPAQDFIDDFEKLAKKHKVERYILITDIDETPILLYRPDDVMEITRVLKVTHGQFFQQVMREIGELNQ